MNHILHILSLLLFQLISTSTASDAPLPPPPVACSDELVTFSMCLPYVADSPNNLTNTPPPQCCDDVSAAFSSGAAVCLCYFMQRPNILGFPINSTKLMSLTSVCPMSDRRSSANFSIETLCSGSSVLPPLESITGSTASPPTLSIPAGPSYSHPPNFGADSPPPPFADSQEPTTLLTPEPADESHAQPNSTVPVRTSSATRIYQVSWTLLILALYIFTSA